MLDQNLPNTALSVSGPLTSNIALVEAITPIPTLPVDRIDMLLVAEEVLPNPNEPILPSAIILIAVSLSAIFSFALLVLDETCNVGGTPPSPYILTTPVFPVVLAKRLIVEPSSLMELSVNVSVSENFEM